MNIIAVSKRNPSIHPKSQHSAHLFNCTDVQDALLKFKPSIKLWKKGDLNGFVVYLLHVFHISISRFCTELTKEVEISIELQLSR